MTPTRLLPLCLMVVVAFGTSGCKTWPDEPDREREPPPPSGAVVESPDAEAATSRSARSVASRDGPRYTDLDDVELVITHNLRAEDGFDPDVVKGLELRVRDPFGFSHRSVIWPWFNAMRSGSYLIAEVAENSYVFRVGQVPTSNGGQFTYYWHLATAPGGNMIRVSADHPGVRAADRRGLWIRRDARIEPGLETLDSQLQAQSGEGWGRGEEAAEIIKP